MRLKMVLSLLKKILKSRLLPYAVCAILLAITLKQCDNLKHANRLVDSANHEVVIWRDAEGKSRAEAYVSQLKLQEFKQYHADILDSIREKGKIKSVVVVTRTITDTVEVKRDSRGYISYSDKYTKIWQPTFDKLSYSIYDSLSVTTLNKRYGFLGLKHKYVTNIYNANPNVHMTGLQSYEIVPKSRRLGVDIQFGYGATRGGFGPYLGVGLGYRVF